MSNPETHSLAKRELLTVMPRPIARSTLSTTERSEALDMIARHHATILRNSADTSPLPGSQIRPTFEGASDLAHRRAIAALGSVFSGPMRTLNLVVQPGAMLVGPPFDLGWHLGLGAPLPETGQLYTVDSETESTCGTGIVIEVPAEEPQFVSVTPIGTHKFSWMWVDAHGLRSRGGISSIAYRAGDPTPLFYRRATIWDVAGGDYPSSGNWSLLPTNPPTIMGGGSGGGAVADAADTQMPPFSFVVPIAPISFNAQPGERYVVWVWLWQQFWGNDHGFLAMHTADLVAFSVLAGPQVIVR